MAKKRGKAPYRRGIGDWMKAVLKGLPVLLIAVFIGVVAGYGISELLLGPSYVTYASLSVTRNPVEIPKTAESEGPQVVQLTGGNEADEAEQVTLTSLLTGDDVCRDVIGSLKLMVDGQPMEADRFRTMLHVDVPDSVNRIGYPVEVTQSGTVLLYFTDTDQGRAEAITKAYLRASAEAIGANVPGAEAAYSEETPYETESRTPDTRTYMLIGGLIGLGLALLLLTVLFLMDDTLRTSKDVERCLGIETIGVIPYSKAEAGIGRTKGGRR